MGKLYRVIALSCVVSAACSRSAPMEQTQAGEARADRRRARAAVVADAPDTRFAADGSLKPGSLRAVWLELPSAFRERPGGTDRVRSYDASSLPIGKVREFLQARLQSDKINYLINGMEFEDARPTHTGLAMAPLKVSVLEVDRQKHDLRLIVEDLTPPSTKPLAPEAAAQALLQDRKRVE